VSLTVTTQNWGEEVGVLLDGKEVVPPGSLQSNSRSTTNLGCLQVGSTHYLTAIDTYGDGWHGAYMEVQVYSERQHDDPYHYYKFGDDFTSGESEVYSFSVGIPSPPPPSPPHSPPPPLPPHSPPGPLCVGRDDYDVGYGTCDTYEPGSINHNYCAEDGAFEECSECGKCTDTLSVTPGASARSHPGHPSGPSKRMGGKGSSPNDADRRRNERLAKLGLIEPDDVIEPDDPDIILARAKIHAAAATARYDRDKAAKIAATAKAKAQ